MTGSVSLALAMLTVASQVVLAGLVVFVVASKFSRASSVALNVVQTSVAPVALWLAFGVAAVAMMGSLYYSEIAGFIPCELCWYQRIAIYPLAVILAIAAARRDSRVAVYSAPLALGGAVISAYHYQLQRFPSQASEFCNPLNPCSLTWVWEFHYISIPMMALTAGLMIASLVGLSYRANHVTSQGDPNAD